MCNLKGSPDLTLLWYSNSLSIESNSDVRGRHLFCATGCPLFIFIWIDAPGLMLVLSLSLFCFMVRLFYVFIFLYIILHRCYLGVFVCYWHFVHRHVQRWKVMNLNYSRYCNWVDFLCSFFKSVILHLTGETLDFYFEVVAGNATYTLLSRVTSSFQCLQTHAVCSVKSDHGSSQNYGK